MSEEVMDKDVDETTAEPVVEETTAENSAAEEVTSEETTSEEVVVEEVVAVIEDVELETSTETEEVVVAEVVAEEVIVEEEVSTDDTTDVETSTSPAGAMTLDELQRKTKLQGKVTRLELYGAFIDVGMETEALIHISKLGTGHVNRVSDIINVGDDVTVWVEKVDPKRNQLMVSMIEPLAVDWNDLKTGNIYTGKVTRLESYGAFIDIGAEREGLVHISELSHDYVKHPSDVVSVDDEVQVQVLGFSKKKRRIDLSTKALMDKPDEVAAAFQPAAAEPEDVYDDDEPEEMPTAMEIALRRAMGNDFQTDSRHKGKGKRRRDKRYHQQDDILSRTLQGSNE